MEIGDLVVEMRYQLIGIIVGIHPDKNVYEIGIANYSPRRYRLLAEIRHATEHEIRLYKSGNYVLAGYY